MAQASSRQGLRRKVRSTVGVAGPITSTVLLVGLLFILVGAALQTGVWAGMFGIMGGLLLLVAVVSRALIWAYRLV